MEGAVVRTEIKNFGGQVVMLLHVSEVERTETGDVEVTCDEGELLYHWDLANPDHRPIDSGELDEVRIDLVHRFGADEMVELVDVAR